MDSSAHTTPWASRTIGAGAVIYDRPVSVRRASGLASSPRVETVWEGLMNAAQVMQRPVVTVRGADTWREALRLLLGGSLNAVPVVDEADAIIGIVTQTDLASRIKGNERMEMRAILDGILTAYSHRTLLRWHQAPEWGSGARVESVMTAPVITAPPDAPLALIARLLLTHEIAQIPVVDTRNRPIGMVGQRDLVSALATGEAIPATTPDLAPFPAWMSS